MIYDIHICRAEEHLALIHFLRTYWSADHIFVHCPELLDFQHKNPDGSYNFWIATNTQTQEIDGVLGFIPVSFYDPTLVLFGDQWGAIWKVRTDVKNDEIGMLGFLLFEKLLEHCVSNGSIGISAVAKKFYKVQRQVLGQLEQYYIKNKACTNFHIGIFDNTVAQYTSSETEVTLREVSIAELNGIEYAYAPRKSLTFIQNRYLNHPIYRYELLGIFDGDKLCGVLVVRHIETQGSRCVRIVDVYGSVERMPNFYAPMQQYLQEQKAEYIDCLNYGIDPTVFERIGFTHLNLEQDQVVVPNYFEPFLRENIIIDLAYKAPKDYPYVVFKADADQDRPNKL